jgi:choline dehydrogenase-like flavoprotein
VGERFQAHPGAAVVGRFKDPVAMGQGATQGYEVPLRDRFMKLESLSMPPEMLGARLPGAGPAWQERLGQLDHFAQWCVLVRMEAHGTVRPTLFGTGSDAAVSFTPTALDVSRLREGLATLCRMMFAAGALEVYPGIAGLPPVLKDAAEVALVEGYDLKARHLNLMASHLFGSACAGRDPARSVVGQDLQAHALPGLYVMDSSVFPTNLGVNPQHSIMGVVWRAAERLAA